MKTISPALDAFFAQPYQTLCGCLKITRADGVILAATTLDRDLVVDGVTYVSAAGGSLSDVETVSSLAPGNANYSGPLNVGAITEADIVAGLYDFAEITWFIVNYRDLTMGAYYLPGGWLGQVSTDVNAFTAELRGLGQALTRTLGRLCTPLCTANLGDARCRQDLTVFTVSGTLTGVSADGLTLFDTARTEPGPSGGVAITGVSNANPGIVTTASPVPAANGAAVTISGVLGPTRINTVTIVRDKSGSTFSLGIDTTDTAVYPPYVSGGTVTPEGAESGYFDYGLFTANDGLNAGLSMEVKAYVPGQWTLQLGLPYPITIGTAYTLVAGCNKRIATCNTKFSNSLNFRGRPYVPGQDKIVQIGRHA